MAVGSGGRSSAGPDEPVGVVAHDLADFVVVEALEFVDVGQRVGEALGVGEVGAEEQSLDAEPLIALAKVLPQGGEDGSGKRFKLTVVPMGNPSPPPAEEEE